MPIDPGILPQERTDVPTPETENVNRLFGGGIEAPAG
jgi:hypothetical protein